MSNSTFSYDDLPPLPSYTLKPIPPLLPFISDKNLALFAPIIAYWTFSMFFHFIDTFNFLPQYRLHTPAEVLKRNHATRYEVLRDVIFQHIIQTLSGMLLNMTEPDDMYGKEDYDVAAWATRIRMAQRCLPMLLSLIGVDASTLSKNIASSYPMIAGVFAGGRYPQLTQIMVSETGLEVAAPAFAAWEMFLAKALYWFVIPALQYFLAILVVDTWQYMLHRFMHTYPWFYATFHSRHHRLYVPYAYGALYNHPVEGFALDTLGAGIGFKLAGLNTRQGMWFFTGSTIKTVDDHCGYVLPWDPLQRLTSNNAGYHDIHHQSWGIKTNYAQPFFTFWDSLLGTQWTGGDVSARYARSRIAAQKSVAQDKEYANSDVEINDNLIPATPAGKASKQAADSRAQVLQTPINQGGGTQVLTEEAEEEAETIGMVTRSAAKKAEGLKGLKERVPSNPHGGLRPFAK
ncbi:MAG: hypothetical protein M1834_006047 [Cirrosporium novae-zelandiae]|nr:MAG: hypothetical protein M1834_006047 [Cirrosporium novae-zelandiae]